MDDLGQWLNRKPLVQGGYFVTMCKINKGQEVAKKKMSMDEAKTMF